MEGGRQEYTLYGDLGPVSSVPNGTKRPEVIVLI